MPQIAQIAETYSSQIFWLLVFFGITFFFVGRGMVPKIMANMSARDGTIASDLAAAQAARDNADGEEEAWRVRENENRAAAQTLVADAKAKAATNSEKKIAEAQSRLDTKMEKAEAEIAAARKKALGEVEGLAVDTAQDIAMKMAGVKVAKSAAQSAVKKAMANA